MTSKSRAERLIDEFNQAACGPRDAFMVSHGIAAVLRHLADTETDAESFYAVPQQTLHELADALTAPSLLDRAMLGDAAAARQFLYEVGFTDEHGQWLPQFRTPES